MQVKTTMRYHFIPVRMAIIKKTSNNKCCENVEKQVFYICWWEYKLVQTMWEIVQIYPKKLEIELSYDPKIQNMYIYISKYSKKPKTLT